MKLNALKPRDGSDPCDAAVERREKLSSTHRSGLIWVYLLQLRQPHKKGWVPSGLGG